MSGVNPVGVSRVGVLGGGQLGRMLAQAGAGIGLEVGCYDASHEACAGRVCPLTVGAFDDVDAIASFARGFDAVTYEFENVPVGPVRALEEAGVVVRPSSRSLEVAQDRLRERELFGELGIATPEWRRVDSVDDLRRAVDALGGGAILKTRRFGYDGKGQALVRGADDAEGAWAEIGGAPAIVDGVVAFEREVSCVVVRSGEGETRAWPVGENDHAGGILRESRVPADADEAVVASATADAERVAGALGHVGVLAVEFFVLGDGSMVANEIAPRVHNTGHWTIEGARTSQFENHMRAVAGMPLGETGFAHGVESAVMVNLIGGVPSEGERGGVAVHDYGKAARPGRKVGHATVVGATASSIGRAVERARTLGEAAVALGAGA